MRKLRAVVVEDEYNIREGIGTFIDMVSEDYEVAGLFADGDEAIEYLGNNRVDLVITDVKMNRISGIELVKYIHENKPETLAVILSGYKEFEYIKSAMTYRVYDYLLKPANQDELKRVLDETAEVIRKRESESKTSSNYELLLPELRKEFFVSLLGGTFKTGKLVEQKSLLLKFPTKFLSSRCTAVKVFVSENDVFFEQVWKYGRDSFNTAIENLIFTTKEELKNEIYFVGDYGKAMYLFVSAKEAVGDGNFESLVAEDVNMLAEVARQMMSCELEFVVGAVYENPIELALKAQREEESVSDRYTLLKTYLSVGNEEEALLLSERILEDLKNMPLPYMKGKLMELFYLFDTPKGSKMMFEENLRKIASAQSVEEIEHLAEEQLSLFFDCGENANETMQNFIIKKARQYIEENFFLDISLQDVADYVHLNPVYFSKYFKEHMQKNFVDYLTDIRMDFAKNELVKGKKIDEVCRLSGYNNSSYFAKIFRNNTGMTPREYQRMKIGCE